MKFVYVTVFVVAIFGGFLGGSLWFLYQKTSGPVKNYRVQQVSHGKVMGSWISSGRPAYFDDFTRFTERGTGRSIMLRGEVIVEETSE